MSNKRKLRPVKANPAPADNRVVVAYIHAGQTSAYFTHSLCGLLLYDRVHGQRITGLYQEWSSANISDARNKLTEKFRTESDADWLLWIDADMQFEPTVVDHFLTVANPERAPIVGGLAFGVSIDRMWPTIYQMVEGPNGPITQRAIDYPDESMVQCTATGAACLFVHRTVIEALHAEAVGSKSESRRVFPYFMESTLSGLPAGEDLTFCIRAGVLGYPVFVHTGIKFGHHKSQLLTADGFREQQKLFDQLEENPADV